MLQPPPETERTPSNIARLDTRSDALIPSTEMTVASRRLQCVGDALATGLRREAELERCCAHFL